MPFLGCPSAWWHETWLYPCAPANYNQPRARMASATFGGTGRQPQCRRWARCQRIRSSKVAFGGILCLACQLRLSFCCFINLLQFGERERPDVA